MMITFITDVDSVVYDGEYIRGGHSVTFLTSPNDMILIKEMFIRLTSVKNKERRVSISEAIEFQKKLRKFGYDKIS